MKKRYWWFVGTSVILVIGTGAGLWWYRAQVSTTPVQPTHVSKKASRTVNPPLTTATLKQHPKTKYACIIYYAVKHLKIQRWQEVSDFDRGWQVEIYPNHDHQKYLVWPDKNIKDEAKQLQPNWFTIDAQGAVTYDSFGVHTFAKDMTATISEAQLLRTLNADHAKNQVYRMLPNLVVLQH